MKKIEWDEEGDHKPIDRSSPEEGKMVIKLKIPKQAPPAPENNDNDNDNDDVIGFLNTKQSEQVKRICVECKKEFSSGKALGGHMRVHVNKNPNFVKPSKTNNIDGDQQTKPYYMNSVNHEGKPTCSQCGKSFPSMKSLFGHMRCHPERVWRGILPPPHTSATSLVTTISVHDEVVDLTKFLRRWPVTDRRGRQAVVKLADAHDVSLLEAVEDLMSLAHAASRGGSRAESGVTGKVIKPGENEIDDESDSNEELLINCKLKIKNPKRMKLMMEHQQVITDECKYKCTTCNKCFVTHQALGGHRSSHNKPKLTSPNRHSSEEHDQKTFVMNVSGDILEKGVHQCKICDKIFATGQALGGHQRCHWSGTTVAPALSSQVTSAGEGGSQTGCDRKVHDFDLNEVPVGMMEEDEGGNCYGYASSSYNSNIC